MASRWDLAGRRTRLTWPDGFYAGYDYDNAGEMTAIRENGATSGVGVLAAFGYDDAGRRVSLTRGNGTVTRYGYDGTSHLASLAQDLAGTSSDQSQGFAYDPSSRIITQTRSNDGYAFKQAYTVNRGYAANGLNQYTAAGTTTPAYDARGNVAALAGPLPRTYGYSSENLLTAASGGAALAYDPALRLYQVSAGAGATTRYAYDGDRMASEYNAAGALQRRYVFGPGADEPLVWYEGSGTADRRWLHADERGLVTAISDASGAAIAIDSYDDYGTPATTNIGRFQYTGQAWLPEIGLYSYKARLYNPALGRFMQTDPIGYADGLNWYNYVGSDPVNGTDPGGLDAQCGFGKRAVYKDRQDTTAPSDGSILVTGHFLCEPDPTVLPVAPPITVQTGEDSAGSSSPQNANGDIIVTAFRPIPRGSFRPLYADDLGPNVNVTSIQGEIGIQGKNLNIIINYIEGKPGLLRAGVRTAVSTAQSLGLSGINITSIVVNDSLGRSLIPLGSLFGQYPGTSVDFYGPYTNIHIPVPR